MLKNLFPRTKQWLSRIHDQFHIRYEDYILKFNEVLSSIYDFIGVPKEANFDPPRPRTKRTYWTDEYSAFMDRNVFETIYNEFYPYLKMYYPEKVEIISEYLKQWKLSNHNGRKILSIISL